MRATAGCTCLVTQPADVHELLSSFICSWPAVQVLLSYWLSQVASQLLRLPTRSLRRTSAAGWMFLSHTQGAHLQQLLGHTALRHTASIQHEDAD